MNENKEQGKRRSKVMRYIIIILALAYFWTSRYQVWLDGDRLVRYNKWTGATNTIKLAPQQF